MTITGPDTARACHAIAASSNTTTTTNWIPRAEALGQRRRRRKPVLAQTLRCLQSQQLFLVTTQLRGSLQLSQSLELVHNTAAHPVADMDVPGADPARA